MKVSFTYSVKWEETMPSRPIPFPLEENYMPGTCSRSWKANWVSTVLIWIAVLSLTLTYLWNYSTRYSKKKKKNSDPELTHGENCNCPPYTSLLGAVLGNGVQLLITVCIFFVLGYYDLLRTCDLKLLSYDISQVHCYTSVVAGYIATSFHTRFTQVGWKECIFQAATIYIVPALITALLANHLAIATYGILALDRRIILESVFFWGIPSAAFAGLGGLLAKKLRQEYQPLCAATRPVREIHQPHWITFTKILTEIFYGILVSFFAMYNGMDDIYASLWKLKSCEAFRVLLASFVLVIVVTVLLAIIFTTSHIFYNGDHQWWWRSIFSSASLVIFMFGYGIYFFSRFESDRGSLIRIFGYNACVSYALFLILGAISFYVSYWVHSTYKLLKDE